MNFFSRKCSIVQYVDIEMQFENKLLLTSKNDIVFYDKTAKAFRIMKKNDISVSSSTDDVQ